jgi:hypothetical protein
MTMSFSGNTSNMRKQYLHVAAYPCEKCKGPVVAGSLGVRENAISRETKIELLGGVCLACGNRQDRPPGVRATREFLPVEWP